jgi:DNA-binding IclR family transcriptional regulator
VYDQRGDLVAMVSAMDSIQFIPAEPPKELIEALTEAASAISVKLAI